MSFISFKKLELYQNELKKIIKNKLMKKVDIEQGTENYGKILAVNEEGNTEAMSVPESMDITYDENKSRLVVSNKTNLPGNVKVDPSLSTNGDAADAKITGDKFTSVEESIKTLSADKHDLIDGLFIENKTNDLYSIIFSICENNIISDVLSYKKESYDDEENSLKPIIEYLFNFDKKLDEIIDSDNWYFQIKYKYRDEIYTKIINNKLNRGFLIFFFPIDDNKNAILASIEFCANKIYDSEGNKTDSEDGYCCLKIRIYGYKQDVLGGTDLTNEEYTVFKEAIENAEFSLYVCRTNVLALNNDVEYTPTEDYNPATKKYVDDNKGVKTWNDLEDKPFEEIPIQVDIFPEQEVIFTDGTATVSDYKDPCYDLNIMSDGGSLSAILVINGKETEGTLTYNYVASGTFGSYVLEYDRITLSDGATVQNGDTVTVHMYANSTVIVPIDEKFLPKTVPNIKKANNLNYVFVRTDANDNVIDYDTASLKDKVKSIIDERLYYDEELQSYESIFEASNIVFTDLNIRRKFVIKCLLSPSSNEYTTSSFAIGLSKINDDYSEFTERIDNLFLRVRSDGQPLCYIVGELLAPSFWSIDIYPPVKHDAPIRTFVTIDTSIDTVTNIYLCSRTSNSHNEPITQMLVSGSVYLYGY